MTSFRCSGFYLTLSIFPNMKFSIVIASLCLNLFSCRCERYDAFRCEGCVTGYCENGRCICPPDKWTVACQCFEKDSNTWYGASDDTCFARNMVALGNSFTGYYLEFDPFGDCNGKTDQIDVTNMPPDSFYSYSPFYKRMKDNQRCFPVYSGKISRNPVQDTMRLTIIWFNDSSNMAIDTCRITLVNTK